MQKNREGHLVGDIKRECTRCSSIFTITSKMTLCPKCNTARVKSNDPCRKMLSRAKRRAKDSGKDFNLEVSDIVIPKFCPVLGVELKEKSGKSGGGPNSPALDRIDNSLGYIKGNVMVISHLANQMKASANADELLRFAEWVLSTYRQGVNVPC